MQDLLSKRIEDIHSVAVAFLLELRLQLLDVPSPKGTVTGKDPNKICHSQHYTTTLLHRCMFDAAVRMQCSTSDADAVQHICNVMALQSTCFFILKKKFLSNLDASKHLVKTEYQGYNSQDPSFLSRYTVHPLNLANYYYTCLEGIQHSVLQKEKKKQTLLEVLKTGPYTYTVVSCSFVT